MDEPIPNLVTGGAGFVGRQLVLGLLADGENVAVVDNLVEGAHPIGWLPDGYVKDDVADSWAQFTHRNRGTLWYLDGDLRNSLSELTNFPLGDVYHLAAVIGGRESIDGEPLQVATDLAIDAEFFNWVVRADPDRVLYASSSAAYPTQLQNGNDPVRLREEYIDFESEIGTPDMTYGWSKLTGEYLARVAADRYDLSVACVRPFSGYGEGQSFDYPIPAIARRAALREDPLTVWGSGTQVRDFIHIDDAVTGMRRALDRITDGSAVNLGTGRPTNFIEVARMFANIAGYSPRISTLPEKPEGPAYRCADPTRMRELLDWEPEIELRRGFERVYRNVRTNLDEPT